MKVILRQDVDELGYEGDVVEVAKGFARNYLIPKELGMEATTQNLAVFEMQKKKIEARKVRAREEAEALRDRLAEITVSISQKAGEEGKLYGSVTSMDLAEEIEKQGVVLDRKKILLEKPIKSLGEFEIPVKIYQEVTGRVKVVVSPESAGSE
ncbi:MAG: 50S ribosomal protein L9 [Desulfobacteraceae bacterium]|jgi:large subunit ribosomal protein L9